MDCILHIRNTKAKQVCVWRNDLKVRTGKKMAQSGHAFEAYTKEADECDMFSPRWFYEYGGKRKIVVSVINEEELDNLAQTLDQLSISHTVIVDSGFTEFNGVPTKTCLGIHPVFDEDIDGVTGNLSLY
ncbi:MAG: peptidyl-tRNA hydrolase [Neisseriaceae bacterium]|nr:MAG: peptidyl-tRNA hydrolase [Neisseriaceae bacterium]